MCSFLYSTNSSYFKSSFKRSVPFLYSQSSSHWAKSAKSRELRGNVGYVGVWVRGLHGSNYYVGWVGYMGQNIFYVRHNFYVGCVGQIYFCVGQNFLRGSLRGSKIYAWIKFLEVVLKKMSIDTFSIIS